MSVWEIVTPLLIALIGMSLSALFSGLETGLYTLDPIRLALRTSGHDPSAMRLRTLLTTPRRTLTVLLIGTNAANYMGTLGVAELMRPWVESDWLAIVLNALIVTPLLLIFSEILPKDLFRTHTDRWTYWLSPVITVSRWAFTIVPLLPIVQAVTLLFARLAGTRVGVERSARQRISQLIREGVGAGMISATQATLTDRALLMRDQKVSSVLVPWRSVVRLPADAPRAAREALLQSRNFTRLPAVDRNGRVVGVLSWADAALRREAETADLIVPPLTLPATTTVLDAMALLRRDQQSLAIVVDAGGKPVGIITLKDLVEPLTGTLPAW